MSGSGQAQSRGEMGLAHAWRAEEYNVFPILKEPHGSQFLDLALIDTVFALKALFRQLFQYPYAEYGASSSHTST